LLEENFGILEFANREAEFSGKLSPLIDDELINREGSVQATIRMGSISIERNHPDYFDLSIANEILGGYFGSRLMRNIREDKGYTYGVYSVLINYRHVNYHIVGADVKMDHVEDSVEEVYKEIDIMRTQLVSDEEMETIKNYMLGKLAGNLDTVFSQSENYKSKLSEGADYIDYFKAYVNSIRNITSERILEVSKKYFPEKYCVVKVA
jgi:predicted Zn-dependent peptidase